LIIGIIPTISVILCELSIITLEYLHFFRYFEEAPKAVVHITSASYNFFFIAKNLNFEIFFPSLF